MRTSLSDTDHDKLAINSHRFAEDIFSRTILRRSQEDSSFLVNLAKSRLPPSDIRSILSQSILKKERKVLDST